MLVDFLEGGKDQLLRFLKVSVLEMGKDLPDFIEINSVVVIVLTIRFGRLLQFGTGEGRRTIFHCCP